MNGGLSRSGTVEIRAAAFDTYPEAMLIVDGEDRILAANEAASVLTGRGDPALVRARLAEVLAPDARLPALIDRCRLSEGPVRDRAMPLEWLGGRASIGDVLAAPLGEAVVSVRLRAATEPSAAPETNSLQSAAGLAQLLAHEVKNPLAGIRGAAQLLSAGLSGEDAPLAQLIIDEVDRIRRLVERMAVLADDAPLRPEAVNIHRVLDRVRAVAVGSAASDVMIRERYDPSLPPVWGDEDQLIQLFLNLVKNGVEAARARGDERGEIVIATAWRQGPRQTDRRAAQLEVTIADNGPGVADAVREHLFDPFVTTKRGGAGLGLALVARLAAAHGGRVGFDSAPGRTVFTVLLPVAAAQQEIAETCPPAAARS